jgi:hypothetical protein
VVDLADDGSAGRVTRLLRSDAFAFPTAVTVSGRRLLAVNGQLDQMGGQPRLPFTVAVVAETLATIKRWWKRVRRPAQLVKPGPPRGAPGRPDASSASCRG